jgi:DNA-binding NtrC family response regulator
VRGSEGRQMGHAILIIDDDAAFRELLQGVFEQAGHKVLVAEDAESGFALLQQEGVGLVVIDQRLPGGENGAQLLRRLHALKHRIPAIIVSGYLNDDAIREFIREGVEGIFLKPLNIFSLLKRANQLLTGVRGSAERVTPALAVGGIRGLSRAGRVFAERAMEGANFRRNLLLIGPEGSPVEEIARDLDQIAEVPRKTVLLRPTQITLEALEAALPSGQGPFTLVLPDAGSLSSAEVDRVVAIGERRSGAGGDVRLVIALPDSVEALYDAGRIDEIFYLFLGTNELQVPALSEMPEDLLEMVKDALGAEGFEVGSIESKLRAFLLQQEWEGNVGQLRRTVARALELAAPKCPGVVHFEAALRQPVTRFDLATLHGFLGRERQRYLDAAQRLGIF